jgi:DNA transposition AAA+ family ATPase
MTNEDKKYIIDLIDLEKERLGSYAAVAIKCHISEATISQIRKGKYNAEGDDMWYKIAAILDEDASDWVFVPTTNTKFVNQVLKDAMSEGMCMAISHKAGSGKTSGIKMFDSGDDKGRVFKIKCRGWNHKEFLVHLSHTLGIQLTDGYLSIDALEDKIISFFKVRRLQKSLLCIDEADKLKPGALGFIIPLENETQDTLAIVISGTEHLEKQIKDGVRHKRKFYDELDSRFGRNMIHLIGATKADVYAICAANGVTNKETQLKIWDDLKPITVEIKVNDSYQSIKVIEDHRRLKRAIKRERLKAIKFND